MATLNIPKAARAMHQLETSLWPNYEQALAQFERDTTTLTHRRIDESKPAGTLVYIQAQSLLTSARDNLDALSALLQARGATTWAPWTLIRAAFDAAVHAVWVIDPDDSLERRRRAVRMAMVDHREWRQWMECMFKHDPANYATATATGNKTEREYLTLAEECRMTVNQAKSKPNLVDEIPKLGVVVRTFQSHNERKLAVGLWRGLSGFAHSHPYAINAHSEITGLVKIPGGQRVSYTVRDDNFEAHLMMTMSMVAGAIHRLIALSRTLASQTLPAA